MSKLELCLFKTNSYRIFLKDVRNSDFDVTRRISRLIHAVLAEPPWAVCKNIL